MFNDPIMKELEARFGPHTITPHGDHYVELISSIVGQQLSVKAADTIWKRVLALYDNKPPSPQDILATDKEMLRSCGVSYGKIAYMQDLALHITDGRLSLENLLNEDNQKIVRELTKVKGIGVWTVHMYLIFCLGRLDVLPVGDLGIRTAIMKLYGFKTLPTAVEITQLANKNGWPPYESVACWYLWKYLDNK
jgi:DNA-3-methyladenine glycosylase II